MMNKIIVNGSLIPSTKNSPLDIRTRVNTIEEVSLIQTPFVGMIFYVVDEDNFYVVKKLKSSAVGNIEIKDSAIDVFEPLINVSVDGANIDLSKYATREFVEGQIAAIEHPQYDDSELRGMFIVDEPYMATYNNRPYVFACGRSIVVEGINDEVIITFAKNDTNPSVGEFRLSAADAANAIIVGGFGNENINKTRILPATHIHVKNANLLAVHGGCLHNGIVGETNVIIENSTVREIIGGGDAGKSINGYPSKNVVTKANVKLTDVKSTLVFAGGSGGPSNVADCHLELNGNCNIEYLTVGGANGFVSKGEVIINGGEYECVQMINRGLVDEAKLVMNGGRANRVYFAGEAEDETVTGIVNHVVFELNNGEIGRLAKGNSNSIEFNGDIKGHIMDCVVVEGDVSMLEVIENKPEVDIDLSEYAKIEFVEEQIAQIELKEGPAGKDGKDFTYDMFTQEQLEALRGPAGKDGKDGVMGLQGFPGKDGVNGKDGVDGADGKSFTYDMFTEEQLADLKGDKGDKGDPFTYEDFTDEQLNALKGMDGVKGDRGLPGEPGKDGENGQDGISITNVEIVERHLMVTLSNDQVLDAGEMPAGSGDGSGDGSGMTPEEKAELESLKQIKQMVLDMTYGVEYEWLYIAAQTTAASDIVPLDENTAPKFYEEFFAVAEDDTMLEEWILNMYAEDVYRMYVLRIVEDPKSANRYLLVPLADHEKQVQDPLLNNYNPVQKLHSWNWDPDGGFVLDAKPSSAMIFAFLKVKEEYRLK